MVSSKSVEDQLKKLGYVRGWNRAETEELAAILMPDEEIFECVNGWYEGGFGLLCATNVRVLLIDKKPFKFLNVEDVRFDTINQIDYSHRLFNASICITTGVKSLIFRSYNQPRLRKLISHVQHRMAEIKRTEQSEKTINNNGSMVDMDQQFRAYLLSQYEQHQSLRRQHEPSLPPMQAAAVTTTQELPHEATASVQVNQSKPVDALASASGVSSSELYEDGVKEIFGRYQSDAVTNPIKTIVTVDNSVPTQLVPDENTGLELNPLRIAYSKLPLILSIKKRSARA